MSVSETNQTHWLTRIRRFFFIGLLGLLDDALGRLPAGRVRNSVTALILLLPCMVILGTFAILPVFYAVQLSMYESHAVAWRFVGFGNYLRAFSTPAFWKSALITLYYVICVVPLSLVISFTVAYLLHRTRFLRSLFRTFYFLPYVTSIMAAGMVWRVMLQADGGILNNLLELLGGNPQQWLLEPRGVLYIVTGGRVAASIGPSLALCCIILFDVWHSCGFMIVVFLAGLSALPRELEEVAQLDGAGPIRLIRHVILPLLSPTILFLTTVGIIKSFQAFSSFFALTGNGHGPLDTTQNLTVYIFANFYEYGRKGYGSAIAVLLAISIILLTVLQWGVAARKVHYE